MRIEDLEYLTEEDVRRIRLVARALDWTPERVVKTPYTDLIKDLAFHLLDKKSLVEQKALIEEEDKKKIKYYENHIVAMQNIKQMDKTTKKELFNELVDVKRELNEVNNIIASINKFIEEKRK